jgi:WS/DGAT/MGAT family acyltransferase
VTQSEQNGSRNMQKLSGIDAMFLALDTSTTSGVVGQLLIYDRTGAPDGASRAAMRGHLLDRLDAIPPLRWRLREVPPRSGIKYWDNDPTFNIDDHLHERVLAAPGTDAQLSAEVSRLMMQPLSLQRPPWDLCVIEGLAGGRVAHLLRLHHALIDGGLMAQVTSILADDSQHAPSPGSKKPQSSGALPAVRSHPLTQTVTSALGAPVRAVSLQTQLAAWLGKRTLQGGFRSVPGLVARNLRDGIEMSARAAKSTLRPDFSADGRSGLAAALPKIGGPLTALNGALTDRREYAFTPVSLTEVKRIGKASGMTVNDVVMAMTAAAVRRYLSERGELPGWPLTAVVAVSTRTGKERPKWTNHVWMLLTPLPTDVGDPIERLKASHMNMRAAKTTFDAQPIGLLQSASFFWPAPVMAAATRLAARPEVSGHIPITPYNLTVSNVRGLAKPIRITGAQVVGNYPVTFLPPGTGLGITAVSYGDDLQFGVMTCPDLVPGAERLKGYLEDALAELSEAVGKPDRSGKGSSASAGGL